MRTEPELNEFLTGRNQFTSNFLIKGDYFKLSQYIIIRILDIHFSPVHSKYMI